ncbi:hypothetical protein H0H81_000882 [Sphagnurus paluster]|uniref:PAS domain-containing protein n=1 Tax=Sphagnurus paluster TaxID=117069 RepID=A0A9P7FPT6_9AGAR|nr:hypothetical protein H0H81_000882 [Sphagnurus paluster]
MPFGRYLEDDPPHEHVPHTPSHGVRFQIPSFMYSGTPTLAPGGGAEVLPYNSTWLTNTGFNVPHEPVVSMAMPTLTAPSPLGLPVYSASGFDVMALLARVVTRPNPHIALGPVDMTCSFVVVDVRRHDHPIVYCSPTFCRLTGYEEHEILGRNCRFLQAPGGAVRRGEQRRFTPQEPVAVLRKALSADKEVQTSIVNFRKDNSAFINLVSVVPVPAVDNGEIVYHVGFQVDLTEQPNVILGKLRDGTYNPTPAPPPSSLPQRKPYTVPSLTMSATLSTLLASPSFLRALPITATTTAPTPLSTSPTPNSPLSLLLCEYMPDFIHVVSLKGAFLYAAPAVSRVLGYPPGTLVGKSLADLAHPEDVVPLERQLKESSVLAPDARARPIDVLFRARTAAGPYVWVECRGRLHVEPGKGRKAIVLSGRAQAMPRITWADVVATAGGLARRGEFWVQLGGRGSAAGALVGIGKGISDVLGYAPQELLGSRVGKLVVEGGEAVAEALAGPETEDMRTIKLWARLRSKSGDGVRVVMVFYRSGRASLDSNLSVAAAPIMVQIRAVDEPASVVAHPLEENIFSELEVSRGSSWQYELQQLRFANRRLQEEVQTLEAEVQAYERANGPIMSKDEPQAPVSLSAQLGLTDMAAAALDEVSVYPDIPLTMGLEMSMPEYTPTQEHAHTTQTQEYVSPTLPHAHEQHPHQNYVLPVEHYDDARSRISTAHTSYSPIDTPALMPTSYQHHHAQIPLRPQTPAHGHQSRRASSSSMPPLFPQQGMYAPMLLARPRPMVPSQSQSQSQSQAHNQIPLPLPTAQQQPQYPQPQLRGAPPPPPLDWGVPVMHPGVKRPLPR